MIILCVHYFSLAAGTRRYIYSDDIFGAGCNSVYIIYDILGSGAGGRLGVYIKKKARHRWLEGLGSH